MDSQGAWEEHEDGNYRQQVFDGDLPRTVGGMTQEEYTWGSLPLADQVGALMVFVKDSWMCSTP